MAQVAPYGGVDSHDIPSERGVRGVQLQNLLLRIPRLQPCGHKHLDDLLDERARAAAVEPYDLHGDGAPAAHHSSVGQIPDQGPADSPETDAPVGMEAAVFVLHQRPGELAGHRIARREPPLAVGGHAGTQQFAVAGRHHSRVGRLLEKIGRKAEQPQQQEQRYCCDRRVSGGMSPPFHRSTAIRRFAVMALRAGWYMSSHTVGGNM